jgi:hypothetical protein
LVDLLAVVRGVEAARNEFDVTTAGSWTGKSLWRANMPR